MRYGSLPSPHLAPEILGLIRTGRVYRLGHPLRASGPTASTTNAFQLRLYLRHEEQSPAQAFAEATETITCSGHSGTHLDALCHVSEMVGGQRLLYGDRAVAEVERDGGFAELGIEQCPPVIARGVLLDLPPLLGVDVLPDSYGISSAELEACARRQGLALEAGICVLIRTGFARYREREPQRFSTVGAGPTPEACRWLAEHGMILVGSDTMSFEQVPSPHLGHLELIRRRGVPILKQLNLEELAANHVHEFLLIVAPLALVGSTASPVDPLAIC